MSEQYYVYFGNSNVQRFWRNLKRILDRKLESVTNKDNTVLVADKRKIAVKISPAEGNALTVKNIPGEEGLFAAKGMQKLEHKLTFGADQDYVFDGSQDVTVPVYQGTIDDD